MARAALGKGLAALLGEESTEPRPLPIGQIFANPNQPRTHFEEESLENLAQSIAEKGVLQPVIVRAHPENLGDYELIAGERRWRAAQKSGLHQIPAIILNANNQECSEISLIENIQRADLGPLEEAKAFQNLIDHHACTQEDLAKLTGRSRSTIANSLRLLSLPDAVQNMLIQGELSPGHARTLIGQENAVSMAQYIRDKKLSTRQAELWVRRIKTSPLKERIENSVDSLAHEELKRRFENALGMKVHLKFKKNGAGELKFLFSSPEQIDNALKQIENKGEKPFQPQSVI